MKRSVVTPLVAIATLIAAGFVLAAGPFVKSPSIHVSELSEYAPIQNGELTIEQIAAAGVDAKRPGWGHGRTLFLEISGASNAGLVPWQKYNSTGEALLRSDAGPYELIPAIVKARQLGFESVVLTGVTGYHPTRNASGEFAEPANLAMPFWIRSDLPQHWRKLFPSWCETVRSLGMEPGVYVGTVAIPNVGTQAAPKHEWIERRHFSYMLAAFRDIRSLGFGVIGLDAANWIFAFRDQPRGRTWGVPASGVLYGIRIPRRDPGIAIALLNSITNDPALADVDLIVEALPPQGEAQGYGANAQVVRSRHDAANEQHPLWSDVTAPSLERLLCRGASYMLIANGTGDDPRTPDVVEGWTWDEWNEFAEHCRRIGCVPATTGWTLYSMGRLDELPDAKPRSVVAAP